MVGGDASVSSSLFGFPPTFPPFLRKNDWRKKSSTTLGHTLENKTCEKWKKHREAGKKSDSFKCYQTLEHDISFIQERGTSEFERMQKQQEHLLKEMLTNFNDGRSRSFYCIAATVLDVEELKKACTRAQQESYGFDVKGKSKVLHSILAESLRRKGIV
jgi:hypothetical protein